MPDTPTPDYASLAATIGTLKDQVAALAAQQNYVITDPSGQAGDAQHGNAVAVIGNIAPYLGSATPVYGVAVWTPSSPSTGAWVQIGGANGSAGYAPGDIKMCATATAAAGWLLCDGAAYTQAAYPALYAFLAAAGYPGASGGNFTVPDLRGRSPVGPDPGGINMPVGKPALGATGGEETHTLAATESGQPAGTTGTGTTGTGTTGTGTTGTESQVHGHTAITSFTAGTAFAAGTTYQANSSGTGPESATHTHSVPGLSIPGLTIPALTIAAAAASAAHNTMHPYQAVQFMIKT